MSCLFTSAATYGSSVSAIFVPRKTNSYPQCIARTPVWNGQSQHNQKYSDVQLSSGMTWTMAFSMKWFATHSVLFLVLFTNFVYALWWLPLCSAQSQGEWKVLVFPETYWCGSIVLPIRPRLRCPHPPPSWREHRTGVQLNMSVGRHLRKMKLHYLINVLLIRNSCHTCL